MLVRDSCKIRNIAISTSLGSLPRLALMSICIGILLLSENPSTNHRIAESRPASSSKGGCNKYAVVRRSPKIFSTIAMQSSTSRIGNRLSFAVLA